MWVMIILKTFLLKLLIIVLIFLWSHYKNLFLGFLSWKERGVMWLAPTSRVFAKMAFISSIICPKVIHFGRTISCHHIFEKRDNRIDIEIKKLTE